MEISREVYNEVVIRGIEKKSKDALIAREYVNNKVIKVMDLDKKSIDIANKIQNIYSIDIGEAETIALAIQLNKKEAIIDEIAAREAAKAFGIKPVGTLRILLIAYKNGLISKKGIKELIKEMENTKYRLSPSVLIEFWDLFEKIKIKK